MEVENGQLLPAQAQRNNINAMTRAIGWESMSALASYSSIIG